MFAKRLAGPLAGSLFLLTPAQTTADVIFLQAVDDSAISSFAPDLPAGNDALLSMEGWFSLGAARPLFKFDLSSIPDGRALLSAQLTLEQVGPADWSGFPAEVWRLPNDNWVEGTVTWNSYDQAGGLEVATFQGPQEAGPRVFDIRIADWNYAQDVLDDSVTFQTRWGAELNQQYKRLRYSSKEGAVVPILRIEYDPVPEPATTAVLLGGLAALLRRRRGALPPR